MQHPWGFSLSYESTCQILLAPEPNTVCSLVSGIDALLRTLDPKRKALYEHPPSLQWSHSSGIYPASTCSLIVSHVLPPMHFLVCVSFSLTHFHPLTTSFPHINNLWPRLTNLWPPRYFFPPMSPSMLRTGLYEKLVRRQAMAKSWLMLPKSQSGISVLKNLCVFTQSIRLYL